MTDFKINIGDENAEFGDFASIEQKRYGCSNEFYMYKVINTAQSNYFVDVPVQSPAKETLHNKLENVVGCIRCGIDETQVLKYRIQDIKTIKRNRISLIIK